MEAWSNMADSKHATGSFKIASWDEGPFAEHQDAPKLTAAKVIATYSGDIDGEGTWEDGVARTKWTVVPGSGTGDLAGLRGEGGYDPTAQAEVRYRLDYR